jgi:hypothetical protein
MHWQKWVAGVAIALGNILVGCSIGYGLSLVVVREPSVPQWKQVPLPDEQQPDHFLATRAPVARVVSDQGRSFTQPCFGSDDVDWDEIPAEQEVAYNHHGSCSINGDWATRDSLGEIPEPPGAVVEQAYCAHTMAGGMGDVCLYVILDNGELWCWRKRTAGMEGVDELADTLSRLFYSVLGGLLGLLVFLLSLRGRYLKTAG